MSRKFIEPLVFDSAFVKPQANLPASAACPDSVIDLETRLNLFIRTALRKSRSGDYPSDICMQLLDRAWKAQKTLWRLRRQNLSAQ
ncbi:MAG: hypothetical protein WCA35_26495 [Kovacikia sp.]